MPNIGVGRPQKSTEKKQPLQATEPVSYKKYYVAAALMVVIGIALFVL